MNPRSEPLDNDERAIADLLARDPLPGPSPQLDARILAAARAATTPGRSTRRPRPRWIAGMGIAATLVLAVGIAWRLRPLPERPSLRSVPVSAVRVVDMHADIARAPPADEAPAQMQPAMEAKPVPAESPRESPVARERAPSAPAVVFDEPAPPMEPAPSPPPPPPAPPAPMAQAKAAANVAAAPAVAASQASAGRASSPDAFGYDGDKDARTLDRVEVTGSRIKIAGSVDADAAAAADAAAEEGVPRALLDEEPPATADSPRVQEAWLQRIRELLSAGDTDAARSSLAEFRRRYPKVALPDDLRALAKP